ncbi:PepSY domain-containing protein [Pusillimonas sp. ANT_WB101]|uniref:PepSY domain-containing protein n=1 Tax=Pusillimonas sp. ANT_WB101 TaxID=2597356 RepID=UPI0011ED4E93|nr:PepSY domain-containing protein [Pusillimonas sp. ANT_WB101]KAA0889331.1 peptidase M4 [Pusillimonas sp. ANT_WB101]
MFRYTKTALVAAILASASVAGYATTTASSAENDASAIGNAKISLIQAITAAEQHVNGKAVQAEYEQTKTGWAYDVEVASGANVFDVSVDANNGTVLSSIQDTADSEDRATR